MHTLEKHSLLYLAPQKCLNSLQKLHSQHITLHFLTPQPSTLTVANIHCKALQASTAVLYDMLVTSEM
uniref:Uncharacterized protein n=1 Tax=Anguilla anguilla TaxID=7936 RepID=A0A0E9R7C3_ANGAN